MSTKKVQYVGKLLCNTYFREGLENVWNITIPSYWKLQWVEDGYLNKKLYKMSHPLNRNNVICHLDEYWAYLWQHGPANQGQFVPTLVYRHKAAKRQQM